MTSKVDRFEDQTNFRRVFFFRIFLTGEVMLTVRLPWGHLRPS